MWIQETITQDKRKHEVLLQGDITKGAAPGLYKVSNEVVPAENVAVSRSKTKSQSCKVYLSTVESWHRRLGFPNKDTLKRVLRICNVSMKKVKDNEDFSFRKSCQLGKSHKLPFTNSQSRAFASLDIVHIDLWGPAPIHSHTGYKYHISFLDDFSRHTWIYPLHSKDAALSAFKHFKNMVENQFERKIKNVHSDWHGEYRSFQYFLDENRIFYRHPCPYTSSQNGRVERKHMHIVELGLTLLTQAHMRDAFLQQFT